MYIVAIVGIIGCITALDIAQEKDEKKRREEARELARKEDEKFDALYRAKFKREDFDIRKYGEVA